MVAHRQSGRAYVCVCVCVQVRVSISSKLKVWRGSFYYVRSAEASPHSCMVNNLRLQNPCTGHTHTPTVHSFMYYAFSKHKHTCTQHKHTICAYAATCMQDSTAAINRHARTHTITCMHTCMYTHLHARALYQNTHTRTHAHSPSRESTLLQSAWKMGHPAAGVLPPGPYHTALSFPGFSSATLHAIP
jgi:hypothetical protein